MDITGGPAAMSGLILAVAICAWALGRWQGGMIGDHRRSSAAFRSQISVAEQRHDLAEPGPRSPQSQLAADPRPNLFDDARSLGELHQHVAAIRRRERMLATLATNPVCAEALLTKPGRDTISRTGQVSGQAGRHHATTEQSLPRPRVMPLAAPRYPSPDWSVWTRV